MSDSEDYDNDYDYGSDNDSHGSDYGSDSPKFITGINQYQHIGIINPIYDNQMNMDRRKQYKLFGEETGEEKFRKGVSQYINENDEFKHLDKDHIVTYIEKLHKIKYKNPQAFVIAYYFIQSGKLDHEIKTVGKLFKNKEETINILDIIRYTRMLRNIK